MKKGDYVTFAFGKEILSGTIEVIDVSGGGSQDGRCTSVDVLGAVDGKVALFKHIPVLDIISLESCTEKI